MVLPWTKGDDAVLAALVRGGDSLTSPRPVVHFTYFPDRASAVAFAADCERIGYAVTTTESASARNAHYRFLVHLERVEPVDKPAFAPTLLRLVLLLEKYHGDYDGWECELVSSKTSRRAPRVGGTHLPGARR